MELKTLSRTGDEIHQSNQLPDSYHYRGTSTNPSKKDDGFLFKIIPEYLELSSFVHNGPNSQKYFLSQQNAAARVKESNRLLALAIQITASTKLFTYLAIIQYVRSIDVFYLKTHKYIKEIGTIA